MKKITSKKAAYWLLGETAGRTSVAAWKWLWGLPVESGGKIARNVAQESVSSMQEFLVELRDAVAKISAAYGIANRQYHLKLEELQQAEQQAKVASSNGNEEAARLALAKAIAIEKILPQLRDRVSEAEARMQQAQKKLKRETEKLEAYKLEMNNLETLSKINGAMAEINKISTDFNLNSARSQFSEAKDGIERKAMLETAKAELGENSAEEMEAEVELLSLEAEIDRRLENLQA